MKAYSPYDNVEAKDYPSILATGGLNDPRVSYWEPAKWIQTLRISTTRGQPIYLKTEMGDGHTGPSGRSDTWKDAPFVFPYILHHTKDPEDIPPSTAAPRGVWGGRTA